MDDLPRNPKGAGTRQRLELSEDELVEIRLAMAPLGYRSLHQFARAVLITVAREPELLKAVMARSHRAQSD